MYDQVANHFVVEIDGRLYDITGDVTDNYDVEPWDELDDDLLKQRIIRDCIMFWGDKMRKLASIRQIANIRPIPGADRIVVAQVDGWECVVQKDEFHVRS